MINSELITRFTSAGQDSGIKELQEHELEEYQTIYNDLISKHIDYNGEVPMGNDIQVINKILTHNEENITPLGLVNVSLEYLARILTYAKGQGIKWHVDCKEGTNTHFKKLSHFNIKVDCQKDLFMTMASEVGFRY